ncbi:MAG TPA: DNA topoisomerase I [Coriobacteriia bacterium]|jgi:DNA topoisomerase-1
MRLVISEKNIAAKRIAEILAVGKPKADKVYSTPVYRFRRDGEDWVSIGLKGHIMKVDFPEQFAKWKVADLAELVQAPVLKVAAEKGIIQSLRNLAGKSDAVIIATDFDREGELIGSDARGIVLDANSRLPVERARFSAITKGEIEKAFAELGTVSDELAQAGEARQDIDLVWGAVLTRYLTIASNTASKRAWGSILSAGRVQTPTLKLIVDRERERDAFVPETYWVVRGRFAKGDEEFAAGHATERFKSAEEARRVVEAVAGVDRGRVESVERTRRTVAPPAPFNTTSLMAAASSEGMSPAQTMRVAESLYMDGLVSYPRVDNTVYPASLEIGAILSALAQVAVYRETANALLGRKQLTPTRGSKEATDHPPIHPTGAADPEKLKPEEWKLYNLVARRFMATLSDAAVVESTKVKLDVAGEPFVARGEVLVVPGFRSIYPYGMRKEDQLPALAEGDEPAFLGVLGGEAEEKQTQPPSRYSQGKMIQEMEKLGLGTKATRHSILQTLYDRKYVTGDPMEPTCQGRSVIEALVKYAERITTPEMTVELEREMDSIAEAHARREQVVGHSRTLLDEVMRVLLGRVAEVGEELKVAADEDAKLGKCPKSGHDLMIKYSPKTKSHFVGCTGYPECDVTFPLPKARYESVPEPCPACGTPQVKVMQFKQKPKVICLDPTCETRREPEVIVGKCPTGDGGDLVVRRSPNTLKRYVRCTNYENCGVSYPLPQSGEIEPTSETCECGEHGTPKIIVHTRKGPWKICINPECHLKTGDKSAAEEGRSPRPWSPKTSKRQTAARKGAATRRRKTAGEGAA